MEESKDLQSLYKIFRTFIYLSLVVEFFEYAINPEVLDFWGGILVDIHDRLKLMDVYQDGHMLRSKIMTFLMICVTCVGTRNKKHLEFNAKRMVIYPITFGVILMFFSVWVFNRHWNPTFFTLHSSTWIYFVMSVVGTVLVHVALDNISKYLKDGLLKDRFNFENESFEQMEEKVENKYSVNIPMRYYYKGKFRKGWVNVINPFRGRRRTNRAISVKLIYWLKLNVNNLKSAIWVKQRKITENIRKGMTSGWLGTSVGNYRFCFPEFPTNLRTLNGLNSIILSLFGMCK